jgi:hypothetical protein
MSGVIKMKKIQSIYIRAITSPVAKIAFVVLILAFATGAGCSPVGPG